MIDEPQARRLAQAAITFDDIALGEARARAGLVLSLGDAADLDRRLR